MTRELHRGSFLMSKPSHLRIALNSSSTTELIHNNSRRRHKPTTPLPRPALGLTCLSPEAQLGLARAPGSRSAARRRHRLPSPQALAPGELRFPSATAAGGKGGAERLGVPTAASEPLRQGPSASQDALRSAPSRPSVSVAMAPARVPRCAAKMVSGRPPPPPPSGGPFQPNMERGGACSLSACLASRASPATRALSGW